MLCPVALVNMEHIFCDLSLIEHGLLMLHQVVWQMYDASDSA